MPPSNVKIPSVGDMKNLDPKELAVNHGEKLVLLVCAVVLLLTILSLMGGVVSGGRVVHCMGTGRTLEEARNQAYSRVDNVKFEGKFFRRDIAL